MEKLVVEIISESGLDKVVVPLSLTDGVLEFSSPYVSPLEGTLKVQLSEKMSRVKVLETLRAEIVKWLEASSTEYVSPLSMVLDRALGGLSSKGKADTVLKALSEVSEVARALGLSEDVKLEHLGLK